MSENDLDKKNSFARKIVPWFIILLKSSKLVAVFKAVKFIKFAKPLVTLFSMMISVIIYGFFMGPWFSIGLILMLFIHEMGHIIAMRIKDIKTSGPIFIPFLGAAIFMPKTDNRETESFIGFGGPLLGSVPAIGCFFLWFATNKTSDILLLVSHLGIILNLFNLLPVVPLDGGRITQTVGSWCKYIGIMFLLGFTFITRDPQLFLIWILVLDSLDNLPLWMRPSLAVTLWLSMIGFIVTGHSQQNWFINILDIFLGSIFILVFYSREFDRKKKGKNENADNRVYPSMMIRAKWLCYYLGLTIILITTLFWQHKHLEPIIEAKKAEMNSSDQ